MGDPVGKRRDEPHLAEQVVGCRLPGCGLRSEPVGHIA